MTTAAGAPGGSAVRATEVPGSSNRPAPPVEAGVPPTLGGRPSYTSVPSRRQYPVDDQGLFRGQVTVPDDFRVAQESTTHETASWIEDPQAYTDLLALKSRTATASRPEDAKAFQAEWDALHTRSLKPAPAMTRTFDAADGMSPNGIPHFTEKLSVVVRATNENDPDRLFRDGRVPPDGKRISFRGKDALLLTSEPNGLIWQEAPGVAVLVTYGGDGGPDRLLQLAAGVAFG